MWQQAGHYYLALRTDFFDSQMARSVNQAQIYDVTCVTGGTCSGGLPAPLSALELDSGTSNFYVTYSSSNGTPFVYFGSDDKCRGGLQHEWLFDVSNPSAPRDVTHGNGYWGWYYRGNPTGFNNVMPRTGKFIGDYFYRAALSIFDIHKRNATGTPTPYIFVGGPATGTTNQALTFSASAAVCTPSPGGWNWNTSGGFISGSATGSSINVTWSTTGQKTVTATNSSCNPAVGTTSVNLGDSSFLSANFSFAPPSPAPGQAVAFDGTSSAGNPTHYAWDFGDGTTGTGSNPAHAYAVAGSYIVRLTVSRPGSGPGCDSSGTCSSDTSRAVIVGNGGPPLPEASFSADVPCINQFGFQQCTAAVNQSVTLTAAVTQTTTGYNWSFGDGTTGSGQVVHHTWTTTGSYAVTLTVSNARGTSTSTQTFIINNGGPVGGCTPSSTRLCLDNNRFAVDVTWRTPQGQTGQGQAVQLTRDTGYFWFFNNANVEMILKVLDACAVNQRFWVFAGGLTNVKVDITVTDTRAGTVKIYHNAQNTPFAPIQDTNAFNTCSVTAAAGAEENVSAAIGTPQGTALLLDAGRFKVEATWRTPQGQTGSGQAVALTNDTGYFWFFNSENVEMVIKILNACTLNQRFWTFAGGLTNVKVDITVTDLQKGTSKVYHNAQNTPFAPIQDTNSFATCP
jgi:PKD repeat protein